MVAFKYTIYNDSDLLRIQLQLLYFLMLFYLIFLKMTEKNLLIKFKIVQLCDNKKSLIEAFGQEGFVSGTLHTNKG